MVSATAKVRAAKLPVILTGATILAQIAWILFPAGQRQFITTVVVVLFTAASLSHAVINFGWAWTIDFALIATGFGLLIEVLGSRTGFPFGDYDYSPTLQPQLLSVPVIVPLAWLMMAYPALILARSVSRRWAIPLAAIGLSTWDLFLDPQMVGEGYWTWRDPSSILPGVPGIPVQNYLGWLMATLVLMVALDHLPHKQVDTGVPLLLYLWTWIGGIVANAVFLGRPAVALWGGLGMAVLAIPAAVMWRRR